MSTPELELRGITRTFGATVANRAVDLTVETGEIHAVVGENGAGKSTLLQIAAGLIPADAGEIRIRGELLARPTPARAIARGVGMVQQHFSLMLPFTVTENVVLGAEPRAGVRLDRARADAEVSALARQLGLELDPSRRVESLSVGEQQRVEILKVLYRKAKLLILDEPTAVLAPVEVDELFRILRVLVAEGHTVVFVTHKLREVMAVSDRVTVMRRGEVVETVRTAETSIPALAERMVVGAQAARRAIATGSRGDAEKWGALEERGAAGKRGAAEKRGATSGAEEEATFPPRGDAVLRAERLRVQGSLGTEAVRGVSLKVHAGEIVGIAGVQGNGQTELIEALAGLLPYEGRVTLAGHALEGQGPGARLVAGLAHIPEDRHQRGLVLDFSVADNLILGGQRAYARAGQLQRSAILANASRAISSFDIRPPAPQLPARALSGGNQQKIVVARELGREPRALLAAQPTRGVDIGAMAAIHDALWQARARGTAILLVSADLSELLELSDRILVLYRGEVVGELSRAEATEARLGALMVGGRGEG